jgi:hypothetical protein
MRRENIGDLGTIGTSGIKIMLYTRYHSTAASPPSEGMSRKTIIKMAEAMTRLAVLEALISSRDPPFIIMALDIILATNCK